MRDSELEAHKLAVRQVFERQFGSGLQIETVHRSVAMGPIEEVSAPSVSQVDLTPVSEAARQLQDTRELLGECMRCSLCYTRKNIVFGVGSPDASLVVIGEAPGESEDNLGEPFVGKAGRMLDRMLENVLGLTRAEVYILNVIKCRPPSNRDPKEGEIEACMPFLERQVQAINPSVILVMGTVALRSLFHTQHGITRHRGEWMEYQGIPVMPTFHPAYLLRKPQDKRLTLSDLRSLKSRLDANETRRFTTD